VDDRTTTHFEPYLHLAGVTADAALVAWGGFWFREDEDGRLRLVDQDEVDELDGGRTESIGARSEPYGAAVVEACDTEGRVVARAATDEVNHAWLHGLEPDTEYRYRVAVDGRPWAEGPRRDWDAEGRRSLGPPARRYDCRFRTHPRLDDLRPVTFLVIGDFGYGVLRGAGHGARLRPAAGGGRRHGARRRPVRPPSRGDRRRTHLPG
jgi:tartrate-resistant acid phosphatase type 5